MEVVASKFSGFCNGVSRSISLLKREIEASNPVFLSSELVHNNLVTTEFAKQNVRFLNEVLDANGFVKKECLPETKESTLVIAAHGIPYSEFLKIETSFKKIVDTTCPVVKKREMDIRSTLEKNKSEVILFAKSESHSEVKCISNNLDTRIYIVKLGDSTEVLSLLDKLKFYTLHTQTTFPPSELEKYVAYLKEKGYRYEIKSRICPSCEERQGDCKNLASASSVVVVVGSFHSSNANELLNIARSKGKDAYLVEDVCDLNKISFEKDAVCALISSASSSSDTFYSIKEALEKLAL